MTEIKDNEQYMLVVNAGSSSLKLAVYNCFLGNIVHNLSIEGIGSEQPKIVVDGELANIEAINHNIACDAVNDYLKKVYKISCNDVIKVGYRVIHGFGIFKGPLTVDDHVIKKLNDISILTPNHSSIIISCLQKFRDLYKNSQHIACFDTDFFVDLPQVAQLFSINKSLQDKHSIRRYGFHGLAYQSVLDDFKGFEGEQAYKGRIILCHLGSGVSVTACLDGKPVDTSMGFTPVSGVMMSTRSGDIEPGIISYMLANGYTYDQINDMLINHSGLLGVSGYTSDMERLLMDARSNPQAELAITLFCYLIKKQIGAYIAVLGGIDSIIFSGGIGERSAEIRRRCLSDMDYAGVFINDELNQMNSRLISHNDTSKAGVHVIKAQEEKSILKNII